MFCWFVCVFVYPQHTHSSLRVNVFIRVSPQDGLLFRLTAASDWVLMKNTISQSALQPGCPPMRSAGRCAVGLPVCGQREILSLQL